MEDTPLQTILAPKEIITETFGIKQDKDNYKLNINVFNQDIEMNLLDEKDILKEFKKKLSLNELKQMHTIFLGLNSCKDFVDYIKALIENNKLSIKKNSENKITIELTVEYLFKQNIIKIELNPKKINFELIAQDLYKKISILTEDFKNLEINYQNIVQENHKIKEENENLKKEIQKMKEEINTLKENNLKIAKLNNLTDSIIIESKSEFDMIESAIKQRMNKEIKGFKKIYQATKDGGDPENFHKKCDNIPNTLTLFKSAGKRRFGAFTSKCIKSDLNSIKDKNCFLFSLDKKKIYPPKDNNYYSFDNNIKKGPNFAYKVSYCILIAGKSAITNKTLNTNEAGHNDIFENDSNALSEDGLFQGIYAEEYEVFQILF